MYQILFSRSYLLSYIHLRKFDVIITQYSNRLTIEKMWIFSDRTSKWISKLNCANTAQNNRSILAILRHCTVETVVTFKNWRRKTLRTRFHFRYSDISKIPNLHKTSTIQREAYFLSFPTIVCYFSKPSILPLRKPERGDEFHYFTSKLDSLLMT